jgi:Glycosyltransferase family 87
VIEFDEPQMMLENSSAAPGGKFFRRCCAFYLCALIGFWIFSVGEMYARSRWLNKPFSVPSSFFVYDGTNTFRDFLHFDPVTERFSKASTLPTIPYPAPMMCVYLLFTRVFPAPLNAYLVFIIISATYGAACLILALCSSRSSSSVNRLLPAGVVGVSVILSYPLMFVLERANMEGFVWAVLALGLTEFVARHHKTAGVLFALAASMKIFPGVLLLLLLARKRYKELAISVVAFAVFTVIALRLLGPSIPAEIEEVRAGLDKVSATHLVAYFSDMEMGYDHSLFAIVKQVLYLSYGTDPVALNSKIRAAALPYSLLVFSGFAALYWLRIRKLPLLNQAIALIIAAVTLPYVSFEYTLTHVYFAWALFLLFLARDVATGRESISWPAARVMLACFAFVFALAPFGRYASGQLKTCALMVLLIAVLTVPMRSSLLEEESLPCR